MKIRYVNTKGGPHYSVNDIRDYLAERGIVFPKSLPFMARQYVAKAESAGDVQTDSFSLLRVKPFDDFARWSILPIILYKFCPQKSRALMRETGVPQGIDAGPIGMVRHDYPEFYACLKEVFLTETT